MRRKWEPSDAVRRSVAMMKRLGADAATIASVVGCSEPTLRRVCRAELDRGKLIADEQVASFLFTAASGQIADQRAAVTAAIFYLKTQCGWR
jgi:hypothetical protein